jgi:hypothetical protein
MKTDKEIKELAIQKLGYDCHEIIYNTFVLAYKLGCDETKQKLNIHGVMQAEGSDGVSGAAVGKEREAKGVSGEGQKICERFTDFVKRNNPDKGGQSFCA